MLTRRARAPGLAALLQFAVLACTPAQPSTPEASGPGAALAPARLRRLSNIEYERTVADLLGRRYDVASRLPPDARAQGYTRSGALALAPGVGPRLAALASELAADSVKERLSSLAPCAHDGRADRACEDRTIEALAARAFRRPLASNERAALRAVFDRGRADAGFGGGIELLLTALLLSPGLWYVSEGAAASTAAGSAASTEPLLRLDQYELAGVLAYTVRGGPPDAELLRAAAANELDDPDARERQARRLLAESDTRHHFRQFVLEWLEVDQLGNTSKNSELFPRYDALKAHMLGETEAFADEVMVNDGARFSALLGAGYGSLDPDMARFYGLDAYGPRVRVKDSGRLGLLQQASFLAAHAHDNMSSPVKRGDFVLRQMLCVKLPRPTELDIEVTIPPPNDEQTTRQRFSAHTDNPSCSYCHRSIDALGFTFEEFAADGSRRSKDNDEPVNTRAEFMLGVRKASFEDSRELSSWLAENDEARACFARQALRYFGAVAEPALEQRLLGELEALEPDQRESLIEILIRYVRSDAFVWRRRGEEAKGT
jgi:hypothetical protein